MKITGGLRGSLGFTPAQLGQRRLLQQVAQDSEAARQALHVISHAQEIRINQRRLKRVLAAQRHEAAAGRAQQTDQPRKAMAQRGAATMVQHFAHNEVQLQIRRAFRRLAFDKATGLSEVGRKHARAVLLPLHKAPGDLQRATERQAKALGSARRVDDLDDADVVVQVLPDARRIVHGGNAFAYQLFVRANAGQHQDLR